ncbi:alpha/beta hydrolase-fold protein [Chitinophaga sp. XS-30]|uniref:carboxylesterase family protein n=1 Tax=Chitinophaga sp. XS-30 TaxID=2604421 RepID=UPI0011DE0E5E|nr:PHB depolymerase family esterase [Chitinophaga sp. XS-30]QEH41519.1 phospholipase [Chitinophaga sp. XS-30]
MRQLFLLLLLAAPVLASAQQGFEARWFNRNGDTLPYRILLPKDYDAAKKYPLVLVLHGAGERGNDNESQLKHGSRLFLNDTVRREFPAIVVFPQCARNGFWAPIRPKRDSTGKFTGMEFPADVPPTTPAALVHQLMDSLLASGTVDAKRVYIGGLSMGGMGAFDMLARFPERFAAAFPICGAGNETLSSRYAKHTALWIFHGEDDNVVPPTLSRIMHTSLQEAGADVKYTEYPGVGHNSWDNAFAEPQLLPWLFSHHL